ncbi:MAG: M24 family metallopeptidase [Halanaeroarchaeum sp.]
MRTQVPASEFDDRLAAVRDRLPAVGADAAAFFDATSIEYLTGFNHIQTERPVVLAVTEGRVAITVPRLEVERVGQNPRVESVHSYFDYPQGKPIETAAAMFADLGAETVAADMDGAPGTMGYEGPDLSETGLDVEIQGWVPELRETKSTAEIDLIETSAHWANLGHRYLADLTEPGAHPVTVSQEATTKASRAMLDTLGDRYEARTRGSGPVMAGFISGEQTRLPHGHTDNRRLESGDVLITGATANVAGYHSELERTMFVGEPTDEQRSLFETMLAAQDAAFEAMGPGVELSAVAEAVWAVYEDEGVTDLAQHHVGHNIGLQGHEPPYIDRGADGAMRPGELYTIEPGLYTEDAGYRHSDTVVVTDDGIDFLTYFPRSLAGNVIEV